MSSFEFFNSCRFSYFHLFRLRFFWGSLLLSLLLLLLLFSHINSHNQVRGHGKDRTGSSHSGAEGFIMRDPVAKRC